MVVIMNLHLNLRVVGWGKERGYPPSSCSLLPFGAGELRDCIFLQVEACKSGGFLASFFLVSENSGSCSFL
jgi:hypothetical protein